MPNKNLYHNPNPHNGPFPYSHVITRFKADTIIYVEPTIPPELRMEPRTKKRGIHVLCIHHKNMPIESKTYNLQMDDIANTLRIPKCLAKSHH